MRIRVRDVGVVRELAAFVRGRGCLVVERGAGELDVHLLNHVSARYDRTQVQAGLAEWLSNHPGALVEEVDNY